MDKTILEQLGNFFSGRDNVLLAILFGSAAGESFTGKSDIDIAVQFRETPDSQDFLHIKDSVSALVNRETDIVVLNEASPIVRMQALKNGIVLFSRSSTVYSDFFVRTVKDYDDLKRIRKEAEDKILRGRMYA